MTRGLVLILVLFGMLQATNAQTRSGNEPNPVLKENTDVLKLKNFELARPFPQTRRPSRPDTQQAIVGGHGEMAIMRPTMAERLVEQRKWETSMDSSLMWTCAGADAGQCADDALNELKGAGCVLEQDPDTLAEKRVGCSNIPSHKSDDKIRCKTTSRNCGSSWRGDKLEKEKSKHVCAANQEARTLGKGIGEICKSKTLRAEKPDLGNVVSWSCSNPPFFDSEMCFSDFLARATTVGCEFKFTASRRGCAVADMENGFILGRARHTTWSCQAETLNCRSSKSGKCPLDYEAYGPVDESLDLLSAANYSRYVCLAKSTSTSGKRPAKTKIIVR